MVQDFFVVFAKVFTIFFTITLLLRLFGKWTEKAVNLIARLEIVIIPVVVIVFLILLGRAVINDQYTIGENEIEMGQGR